MTGPPNKFRGLLLAGIIVCSVFAASATLSGTAAGTEVSGNTSLLTTGPNWYGQTVVLDISENAPSEFSAQSGDDVYLLEVDGNSVNRTVQVLTVDSNDEITLDTNSLDDDERRSYALNDDNELNSGAVNFTLEPQTLDTSWEQDSVATDSESFAVELDSNRGSGNYNLTISAEGFDYDQLRALFIHPGSDIKEVNDTDHLPLTRLGFDRDDGDDVTDLRENGYITLNVSASSDFSSNEEIVANFSNLDETETVPEDGEYQFETLVPDSTAEDTARLRIGGAEVSFGQSLYTRPAGDVASFTVDLDATNEAWVLFQDANANYVDVLYLRDDNGDGAVTFHANTRLIGTDHSQLAGVSGGDSEVVYHSQRDTVQSYIHHEEVPSGSGTAVSDATFYDGADVGSASEITFSSYVDRINGNTPTTQLGRPLQPTSYELVVDRRGRFVLKDGVPAVDREIGDTELDLVQPSLRSFETQVAPSADADSDRSIPALEGDSTERDTVAIGDRMILQYDATGITGALATIDFITNGNDINEGLSEGYGAGVFYDLAVDEAGTDWEGEGIDFSLRDPTALNTLQELTLDEGGDRDAYILVDQQTAEDDIGQLYVVINSDAAAYGDDISDEQSYDANLSYALADSRFEFGSSSGPQGGAGGNAAVPAYPYYGPEFFETVSEHGSITFESPSVTFDSADDETIHIAPSESAELSGRTNLAPGTEVTVGVRLGPPSAVLPDEDPSFLAEKTVVVGEDGTFNATFDLSGRTVGEAATVRFTHDDRTLATEPAEFRDIDTVRRPFFEIALDVSNAAEQNESVNITTTVTNSGQETGTAEVTIRVDESNALRAIVDLEQGESRQFTHSVEMDQSDIDILVSTQDTEQRTTVQYDDGIEETETATPTETPTETTTTAVQTTPPTQQQNGGNLPLIIGSTMLALLSGASVLVLRWY